jgi:glutamate-ammonia-ligase adenylyltransferase
MAVLALGKFGGMELGFGSDLDLLILYDNTLQPDSELPQKLASERVVEMSKRTPEGRLFEVDMRLRPYGKSAPLVPSLEGATEYYRQEGQTWERLALTRLRILWGSTAIRKKIHDRLTPWIFQKGTLGPSVSGAMGQAQLLTEIREMRARIEKEKTDQPLKCGPGGLMDVEFIAQTGQLIWGAEHPALQHPGTLRTLHHLHRQKILDDNEYRILTVGYHFLREIENRLSLLEQKGARGIPSDPDLREHLARCLNTARKDHPLYTDKVPPSRKEPSSVSPGKRSPTMIPQSCSTVGSGGDPLEVFTAEILSEREQRTRGCIREVYENLFDRGFIPR